MTADEDYKADAILKAQERITLRDVRLICDLYSEGMVSEAIYRVLKKQGLL